MLGRTRNKRQLEIFEVPIARFINPGHELVIGANQIDWEELEESLKPYYSDKGRRSIPPRKIIGMMLLKERFNLSDEKVLRIWPENPYWQYFCGEIHFQPEKPFSLSELTRFRRRIGEPGHDIMKRINLKQFANPEDKSYETLSDRRKRSFWKKIMG